VRKIPDAENSGAEKFPVQKISGAENSGHRKTGISK